MDFDSCRLSSVLRSLLLCFMAVFIGYSSIATFSESSKTGESASAYEEVLVRTRHESNSAHSNESLAIVCYPRVPNALDRILGDFPAVSECHGLAGWNGIGRPLTT